MRLSFCKTVGCIAGLLLGLCVQPVLGSNLSASPFKWNTGFLAQLNSPFSESQLLLHLAQTSALQQIAQANETSTEKTEPDVTYVPTPQKVVEKMLELAQVQKDDLLYDLGCGDGRIVVTAAKKYGCRAIGFDIDPERIEESKDNVKKNRVEHLVQIKKQDIFELDLSKANVITLYLLESLNKKLVPQLKKLKPGSRIVSHQFAMGDIEPDQEFEVKEEGEDSNGHMVYLWITPLKVEE